MKTFNQYHNENPQIWREFKKLSFEAKNVKGFKNYSANGIFEVIRWNTEVSADDKYKINNNYRGDYARKLMAEYPEFKGFFRVRTLKAKRHNETI